MSIDLTIVCVQQPDLVVCERLARVLLRGVEPAVDVSAVGAFEVPSDRHEFGGQSVWSLEPASRTPAAFLATYVLAVTIALLYLGELVDDSEFFPELDPYAVIRTCTHGGIVDAVRLWDLLCASGPAGADIGREQSDAT